MNKQFILKHNRSKSFNNIYVPLIGSGNGGLSKELTFLLLLISIRENISNRFSQTINIVIYRNDNSALDISENRMKGIVKFALDY